MPDDLTSYSAKKWDRGGITSNNIGQLSAGMSAGAIGPIGMLIADIGQLALLTQQFNTAQNYYNTNLTDFNFFVNNYEPNMKASLTEAINRPYYDSGVFLPQYGTLDYLASTGRGASIAARKLDEQWYKVRRRIKKYNTGLGRWLDFKFSMAKFNSILNGWNLGFRFEDHRKDVYYEQRHQHILQILNLGIGVGNVARKGLATSVAALSEARTQMASQISSIGNGLGEYIKEKQVQNKLLSKTPEQLSTAYTPSNFNGPR
ncbi:MAG: hypothetical protein ACREQ5_04300 [Candidatus Dormibacteria bacterium]